MATKNNMDHVWTDIFESLILTSEPPQKYIKKVIITTTRGEVIGISAQEFSAMLEQEKHLPPGTSSDIQSARMSLDFIKIKRDINKWTRDVLVGFDTQGKPKTPKFSKPKPGIDTATVSRRASKTTPNKKPSKA